MCLTIYILVYVVSFQVLSVVFRPEDHFNVLAGRVVYPTFTSDQSGGHVAAGGMILKCKNL